MEITHLLPRDLKEDVNPGGYQLFAVQATFLTLAWVSIILRGYVKIHMIKQLSLDDYLMFAAMLMYTAYASIAMWGILKGTGQHTNELPLDNASQALEGWYLCEVIYAPLSALVRTSIGVFLLRIANQRIHRIIVYTTMVVIWVLSVIFFFLMTFQCWPPSHFWEQIYRKPGSCMDLNIVPAATIAHSVISALCDFVLALLPIAIMWNVQLNKRTKVTIAALLSMGVTAGIALIVRIPYIKFLAISSDFLFETIGVAIWSVMEPSLGIIAGCIATLRPLFKTWGFGPSGHNRNYQAKSRSTGASSSGWRVPRGMQKLRDEQGTVSREDRPAQASDLSCSDIELVTSGQEHDRTEANEGDTTLCSYHNDVEAGNGGGAHFEVPPSVVRIQTSINIISQPRQDAASPSQSAVMATASIGNNTQEVQERVGRHETLVRHQASRS